MDSVIKSGDVGTWSAAGITKDLWVGIPAGIRYVNNETVYAEYNQLIQKRKISATMIIILTTTMTASTKMFNQLNQIFLFLI